MTDATIISAAGRVPIIAQRRKDGGVSLRMGRSHIVLSTTELDKLYEFTDEPIEEPMTATTPANTRLA